MSVRSELVRRVEQNADRIIELLQEFVRIPSENPPGDTTAAYAWVASQLDRAGVAYDRVAPVPEWPNLVATITSERPGRHLILNGHLDIFPAGDPATWTDPPYAAVLRDGKVYGRGVADMKAGTLSLILTYLYLAEIRPHLAGTLTLTVVSDEETGDRWGTGYLMEHHLEVLSDAVLNAEPSSPYAIQIGEKGPLMLELTVRTRGGHSASPHTSPNAILIAAQIIGELGALTTIEPDIPDEVRRVIEEQREVFDMVRGAGTTDLLRQLTVNVGVIDGGNKVNVIPAQCRVQIDVRCPIGVSGDVVLERFEGIIGRYPGASYKVISQNEFNYNLPDVDLFRIVQRNAEAVRGIRPVAAFSVAGSDGRFWRWRGIPAIVHGPRGYNVAAPDEHVTVEDMLGLVKVHLLSAFDYLTGAEA